jgi:cytochrome b6-f complex iron-sulfur subunit
VRLRKTGSRRRGSAAVVGAVADGRPVPSGRNVEAEDVDALRAAIELNAARPGTGQPSDEFIHQLHDELAETLTRPREQTGRRAITRRALVTGAGVAAAGVVGVAADRTLLVPRRDDAQTTVQPDDGSWVRVAAQTDVSHDGAVRFETPTTVGFVSADATGLVAVSGTCTHQGCLLQANGRAGRLDCPCHRTAFGYGGNVLFSQLAPQPVPLPRISVRGVGDDVEVFLPNPPS